MSKFIKYENLDIVSIDILSGVCIIEDIPFLPEEASGTKIGNVFYNQGLIVLTRNYLKLYLVLLL